MNFHPAAVAAMGQESRWIEGFQIAEGSDEDMIPVLEDLVGSKSIILRANHRSLTAKNAQQVIDDFHDLADNVEQPLFVGTFGDGRRHSGVAWADHTKPILQKSSIIRQLIAEIEVEWWIMNGKNVFSFQINNLYK
jgi:hypothetical protein